MAGLVLGTETFARSLKPSLRVKEREQRPARNLERPVAWKEIILAVERAREESWAEFSGRYCDWGRDAALWFGRRQGRLPLARQENLTRRPRGIGPALTGARLSVTCKHK